MVLEKTLESPLDYKESYFGDMIDTLRLNPAKVKKALTEKGYTLSQGHGFSSGHVWVREVECEES